ncbi:hypothetical protein AAMO2058_001588200 [Amorphochlora amoebiformis]
MAATLWVFMAVLSAPLAVSMRESKPVVVKKNPFIIVQESSQSVLQPNANLAKKETEAITVNSEKKADEKDHEKDNEKDQAEKKSVAPSTAPTSIYKRTCCFVRIGQGPNPNSTDSITTAPTSSPICFTSPRCPQTLLEAIRMYEAWVAVNQVPHALSRRVLMQQFRWEPRYNE